MKPLDDELRNLFQRKEPPEGFAERVLARLDALPTRLTLGERLLLLLRRPALRWAAVGALACVLAIAGVVRYQHQQRMRAQAELTIEALEFAGSELNTALEQAHRITVQTISAPIGPNIKRSDHEKRDKY